MWLLQNIDADYYMFCDQDDIWLTDKIEKSLNLILNEDVQDIPILVHTDLFIVNEKLEIINDSYWNFTKKYPYYSSFEYYCTYNNVTGCTIMINRKARDLSLDIPLTAGMHDKWLALVVSFYKGKIIPLNLPTIYYRQHSNNVIGASTPPSIVEKLYNIKDVIKKNYRWFLTIRKLRKISLSFYIYNKIKYYLLKCFR